MAGGRIYFITPVAVLSVANGANTNWTTLNLSGHVPAGATGVLLDIAAFHVSNGARLRVRKNGYSGSVTQRVETDTDLKWIHNFVIVACDTNPAIQYKLDEQGEGSTASYLIRLFGYVM